MPHDQNRRKPQRVVRSRLGAARRRNGYLATAELLHPRPFRLGFVLQGAHPRTFSSLVEEENSCSSTAVVAPVCPSLVGFPFSVFSLTKACTCVWPRCVLLAARRD